MEPRISRISRIKKRFQRKVADAETQRREKRFALQSDRITHIRGDFTTDGTDNTDFLEQEKTKKTKDEFFFVSFVCFCGDFFPESREDGEFSIRAIREIRGSIPLVAACRAAPGFQGRA